MDRNRGKGKWGQGEKGKGGSARDGCPSIGWEVMREGMELKFAASEKVKEEMIEMKKEVQSGVC